MAASALEELVPRIAEVAPRVRIAQLPTPVHALDETTGTWIKRDDLTSDRYGGNKVRKLEFLLARAQHEQADRLLTIGAIGSHHALATTVHGSALGFDVSLALLPQPLTPHVREVLTTAAAHGAVIRVTRSAAGIPLAVLATRIAHWRERVHTIPAGGSDGLGTLGYVEAALELARQQRAGDCPAFAEVHVAGGTLGTAAGLALGFELAGVPTRIVAHRITVRAITNERTARRLVDDALVLLSRAGAARLPQTERVLARLRIAHDQIGAGYGHATDGGRAALDWFAGHGIALDATYTAKAAAGFLAGAGAAEQPRLFWHTLSATLPEPMPVLDPARQPKRVRRILG